MKIHKLKSSPFFFGLMEVGIRTFDVRLNERKFSAGDVVDFHEYNLEEERFTGRTKVFRIKYVEANLTGGLKDGHVVIGLEKIPD